MKTWTWPAWLDNCAMVGGLMFFFAVMISLLAVIFLSAIHLYDVGPRRRRNTKQSKKAGEDYAEQIEGYRNDFK